MGQVNLYLIFMHPFFVGVVRVILYLRYAQTLKDRRQVVVSLKQKLRNAGFSVTECGNFDSPKQVALGFSYSGSAYAQVQKSLEEGLRLFEGLEITQVNKDILDRTEGSIGYDPDAGENLGR